MNTRLYDAVGDEAEFFGLVAGESGVPTGSCHRGPGFTRVVAIDGQAAGFYRLSRAGGCGHGAELDHLMVYENRRGHGLGRLLLGDLGRTAASLGEQQVRIVSHPPLASFFARLGARRVGTEPPGRAAPWSRPVLTLATRSPLPSA